METINKKVKVSIWKAPQFSVAIFVIISAYTTGKGMTDTFFDGNFICGVGISIGIQLLLVWLGWKIPKMFSMGGCIARLFLVVTYTLTIMWSTGFSFVYVCNHVYSSFYMRDDQSLLDDTYRKSMIDLERRSENDFNRYLDIVIEKIGGLQEKAGSIDNAAQSGANVENPDYNLLRRYYKKDAEVMGLIDKCELITTGKSIGNSDKMHEIIQKANKSLNDKNEELKEEIDILKTEVKELETMIANRADQKYKYKTGTTADNELADLIAENSSAKGKCESDIKNKETEQTEIENVIEEIKKLDSYLSSKEDSVEGILVVKFAQVLAELGSTSPQMNRVNNLTDEIYKELTTALQVDGDNSRYSDLLRDYLTLKESLKILENVRNVQTFCYEEDRAAITGKSEVLVSSSPSEEDLNNWMDLWDNKFVEIKSNYYRLPSASEQELTDTYNYISYIQRSLLTNLNGIERAGYYLFSAHAQLAWCSLILALFLDLVPILIMIIKVLFESTISKKSVDRRTKLAADFS